MVSAAVDLPVLVEVDQIYQQLVTCAADEAPRVPTHAVTRPGCKNGDVATVDLTATLQTKQTTKRLILPFGGTR